MASPEEWFRSLPPITRTWLSVSFLTTVLVQVGYLSPMKLAFIPELLMNGELWRLVTPFIFLGPFGFPFVMNLFFLVRYSGAYESSCYALTPGSFQGTTADYAFALMVNSFSLLLLGFYFEFLFLGTSLVFSILYLWSKRNPDTPVSFWGFNFKGAFLPFVLMGMTILMGGSPMNDLLGVAAGHIFYFSVEVLPLKYERTFLETPAWLIRFVDWATDTTTVHETPAGRRVIPPARNQGRFGGYNWGQGQRLGG